MRRWLVALVSAVLAAASAGTVVAQTPTTEADGGPEPQGLVWNRADLGPQLGRTASVTGVVALPDGSVLMVGDIIRHGKRSTTFIPTAWNSEDGLAWQPTTLPGPAAVVEDVTTWAGGVAAIGESRGNKGQPMGLVWTSADGLEWTKPVRFKGTALRSIAATPEGIAVSGVKKGDGFVWESTDGRSWVRTRVAGRRAADTLTVASDGTRLAAGPRMWRSPDGTAWERVELPPDFTMSDRFFDPVPRWTPNGFVYPAGTLDLTGESSPGAVWSSADGIEWAKAADSPLPVNVIAGGEDLVVAFTVPPVVGGVDCCEYVDVPTVVLSSSDGEGWRQSTEDAFRCASVKDAVVMPDRRVLAVGEEVFFTILGDAPRPQLLWVGEPGVSATTGRAPEPGSDASTQEETWCPFRLSPSSAVESTEDDLAMRAGFDGCRPWRQADDEPFVAGARAAIRCGRPAKRVTQLAVFVFEDPDDLARYWQEKLESIEAPTGARDETCVLGQVTNTVTEVTQDSFFPGETEWDHGRIACYLDGGVAKVRWTDERTGYYGVLDGTTDDLAGLHTWWRRNARSIGDPGSGAAAG